MRLRDYQDEACAAVFRCLGAMPSTLLVMATGLGKAQPVDAKVLTPYGFMPIGDLEVGDQVIGSNGEACSVTGVFPQGFKKIFRVTTSDHASTRCCEEHLWAIRTKSHKFRGMGFQVKQLKDFMHDLCDGSGANKWFLPIVQPVNYAQPSDLPLLLDPYILGLLIGDGGIKYAAKFSTEDPEIVSALRMGLPGANIINTDHCNYSITYDSQGPNTNPLLTRLRILGLFGKGSEEKFIPENYLRARVSERIALLQGLMDSDGYISEDGAVDYSTVSPQLARDVCELVRSLGVPTRVRIKPPGKYTYKDEYRTGLPSFRISVPAPFNPFRLARKASLFALRKKADKARAITGVEADGEEECVCISVDAPDQLYVTDDYILTHNTVVFSHIANDWQQGRVLIIAHRDELIRQAAEKVRAVTGESPGIEMGAERLDEKSVWRPKVVVSSVQTLCRPNRHQRFRPEEFGLLVFDEAHHATATTWRGVLGYFRDGNEQIPGNPDLRWLGVTATPNRADNSALGQIFHSKAFEYGIEDAVKDGYLVPVQQKAVVVDGLDFSRCSTRAGDFSAEELERVLLEEKMLHGVAAPLVDLAGNRSALVFCATVAHAERLAEILCRYRPHSAIALSGATPSDERRAVVERFKQGEIQYLCNCALFLEGFDAPNTAVVVMARPTKSTPLYMQVLGRGTRPLPGIVDGLPDAGARRKAIGDSAKPFMTVLDFVGNSGRHKIVTAADVLGGKYGEPVRRYAQKTAAEEGQQMDVFESLERAEAELELLEEIEQQKREALDRERRRHIQAQAFYRAQEVSPFGGGRGVPRLESSEPPSDRATDNQVWFLVRRAGWHEDQARKLSRKAAGAIIGRMKREGAA